MQFRLTRPGSGLAAVVLTIAVMATACGGGGDDEASPGPNATSAPASDGGADKARGEGGAYCDVLNEQAALLTAFLSRSPAADPATQQQFIATQKELNNKALKAAPTGIRSDVETQVRASNAVADAQISGDPAAMTAATERLRTSEFQAAASRVDAYNKDQCGIDATSLGVP